MSRQFYPIFLLLLLLLMPALGALAQGVEQAVPGFPKADEEKPKGLIENLERMRIDRDKKDHEDMLAHGEEAVKISSDVERAFETNGTLTDRDLAKVAQVEKLVKKIRDELGGNGDGDVDDPEATAETAEPLPQTQKGMIEALKRNANSLFDQLKQTTRFTISASAIVASNTVLKIARFLKGKH